MDEPQARWKTTKAKKAKKGKRGKKKKKTRKEQPNGGGAGAVSGVDTAHRETAATETVVTSAQADTPGASAAAESGTGAAHGAGHGGGDRSGAGAGAGAGAETAAAAAGHGAGAGAGAATCPAATATTSATTAATATPTPTDAAASTHPRRRGKNRKRKKSAAARACAAAAAAAAASVTRAGDAVPPPRHPFPTDPDDHCETPLEAYADVVPFLTALASRLGVHPAKLRVYDPYFCAGGVKDRLGLLGYGTVFNACRDAYADWDTGSFPDHDVLVTNPPYSDDHMEKLVRFVARRGKPFALLMPNFVYTKAYFSAAFSAAKVVPFFVAPFKRRYTYQAPDGLRSGPAKTAPFPSMWYMHLGAHTAEVCTAAAANKLPLAVLPDGSSRAAPTLARTALQLPYELKDDNDPEKKRLRNMRKRRKRT